MPFLSRNRSRGRVRREKGNEEAPGKFSHKTLLKGEDMRARCRSRCFCLSSTERERTLLSSRPVNSNSPTSCIHAYARIRAHAIIRRVLSAKHAPRPSAARTCPGTLRPLARQIFISRAPAARRSEVYGVTSRSD